MDNLNTNFKVKFDLGHTKIYRHNSLNIALVRYEEDVEINLERATEVVKYCIESIELTKPVYAIIYPKDRSTVNEEARVYYGNDDFNQKLVKATSVVVNGIVHRLIFNVYLKINRPQSPIKAFINLNDALFWLENREA